MKKKLVIGTFFTVFIIAMMPVVSSIQEDAVDEVLFKDNECTICAENENNFFDILEDLGMSQSELKQIEGRITEIKQQEENKYEATCLLIIYFILWLIQNLAKVVKCIACILMFIPLIPTAVFSFIFCNDFGAPGEIDFPPICDSINDVFGRYLEICGS